MPHRATGDCGCPCAAPPERELASEGNITLIGHTSALQPCHNVTVELSDGDRAVGVHCNPSAYPRLTRPDQGGSALGLAWDSRVQAGLECLSLVSPIRGERKDSMEPSCDGSISEG